MQEAYRVITEGEVTEIAPASLAPIVPTVPPPVHDGYIKAGSRLAGMERQILALVVQGETLMFQIAELIKEIEAGQLYKDATNPDSGAPYRTMGEYYPALLSGMKRAGVLNRQERTVREWVRLYELFVEGMGIAPERILAAGTSHFSEIADAMDYNRATKEVAETPKEGKIGKAAALEYIAQIEEAKAAGIEWRVEDTRQALDVDRGVIRRSIQLGWGRDKGGNVRLYDLTIWEGEKAVRPAEGCTPELAAWLDKRLGAKSNLPASQ